MTPHSAINAIIIYGGIQNEKVGGLVQINCCKYFANEAVID